MLAVNLIEESGGDLHLQFHSTPGIATLTLEGVSQAEAGAAPFPALINNVTELTALNIQIDGTPI